METEILNIASICKSCSHMHLILLLYFIIYMYNIDIMICQVCCKFNDCVCEILFPKLAILLNFPTISVNSDVILCCVLPSYSLSLSFCVSRISL